MRFVVLLVLWSWLFSGCATTRWDRDLLQAVPSDTPYFVASLEAPPDHMETHRVLGGLLEMMATAGTFDPVQYAKMATAVDDAFGGLDSAASLRAVGIDPGATWVLYGRGVLPSLRCRLIEPTKTRDALSRLAEGEAGEFLKALPDGNGATWRWVREETTLVVGVVQDTLVVGLVLNASSPAAVEDLLQSQSSGPDLAASGRVEHLIQTSGMHPIWFGYVEHHALLDSALSERRGGRLSSQLAALGMDVDQIPGVCRDALVSTIAHAPRLRFGTDSVTRSAWTWSMEWALSPELRAALQDVTVGLVSLGVSDVHSAVAALGVGLRLDRLLPRLGDLATEWSETRCSELVEMGSGLVAISDAFQGAPIAIQGFQSLLIQIQQFGAPLGEGEGLIASALFENRAPGAFYQLVTEPLQYLNLSLPSFPVDQAPPTVNSLGSEPRIWASRRGDQVALATGDDASDRVASWTEQRVESALPFLLLHLDLDWIQGLIGGEGGAGPEATWGIGWTGVGTFSASVEEEGLRVSMQLQWEESEAVGTAALSR